MKDEIKEILDNVKKCCDITKDQSFTVYQRQDILVILDCITNLQEELKSANESITWWQNRFNALQKENEKLQKIKEKYQLKKEIYKLRNEKAVEFIKEKISSTKGVINDYMYHKEHNKHLIELLNEDIEMYKNELNILKGEDKDE